MRVFVASFWRCLLNSSLFALALGASLFALLSEAGARASERLCRCPRGQTRGS